MEKLEELEEVMIKGINRSLSINKFTTELYKAFPSIPSDKMLSVTRSFLENLELLEKIYKAPEKCDILEEERKHIPHLN